MQPFLPCNRLLVNWLLISKSYRKMKKYFYLLIICCSLFTDIFSQEIRIKRQFFVPQSEYYSDGKYIGNSVSELAYFIETHSEDSLIVRQIKSSKKLTEVYPKIYLFRRCLKIIFG